VARRDVQKRIRSKVGMTIKAVRTAKVPGEPSVVAVVELEDGTVLHVTRIGG
jgi:hypothetical protein